MDLEILEGRVCSYKFLGLFVGKVDFHRFWLIKGNHTVALSLANPATGSWQSRERMPKFPSSIEPQDEIRKGNALSMEAVPQGPESRGPPKLDGRDRRGTTPA